MNLYVLYNEKQRAELIRVLSEKRLPFKCLFQDMYPLRSLGANDYLWGVVYPIISDYTGHTNDELHEYYKNKFNLKYDCMPKFDKKGRPDLSHKFELRVMGTSEQNTVEFENFCLMVRVDAMFELNLNIPLPSESISDELKFS